jgi:hypothetical protein
MDRSLEDYKAASHSYLGVAFGFQIQELQQSSIMNVCYLISKLPFLQF